MPCAGRVFDRGIDADRVVLEIVTGPGWGQAVADKIHGQFAGFLEDGVAFEITCVDVCTKTKSGKRNTIINMMNR